MKNKKKKNNDKVIHLHFDRYVFPVSYDSVKTFILNELIRLAAETGYSIDDLIIEFMDNYKDDRIAYFSHYGDRPVGFCFFINKLDNTSSNKIIDVCRHEFSHFVVCMQNAGHQPKDAHGSKWKKVCNKLGAVPSAFLQNSMTKHLV